MTDDYMIHGELVLKNDVSQLKNSINYERIDGKNICLTLCDSIGNPSFLEKTQRSGHGKSRPLSWCNGFATFQTNKNQVRMVLSIKK